jgi:hypothetical protein
MSFRTQRVPVAGQNDVQYADWNSKKPSVSKDAVNTRYR